MSVASPLELEMLTLLNAERTEASLEPLTLNTRLNQAAEDHSAWMLEANVFNHTGEGGSTAGERMEDAGYPFQAPSLAAENIGWQSERGDEGYSDDVEMIHESLMQSPGHRANILDPDATEIGIGIETGDFTVPQGTFDAVMVTQNFATTAADTSAWRDPGTGEQETETPVETVDDNMIAEMDEPAVTNHDMPSTTDESDDQEELAIETEETEEVEEPVSEDDTDPVEVDDTVPVEEVVTALDDLDFDFQNVEGAILFVFDWAAFFAKLETFWGNWEAPVLAEAQDATDVLATDNMELPTDEFIFDCA